MTTSTNRHPGGADPETLRVDRSERENARWLIAAVGEFVRFADLTSVYELLDIAGTKMSPDGLMRLCDQLAGYLGARMTAVTR